MITAFTPDVVSWRARRLQIAGVDRDEAARLASRPGFDLHAFIELVERGCPPALALRITAPLDGPGEAR